MIPITASRGVKTTGTVNSTFAGAPQSSLHPLSLSPFPLLSIQWQDFLPLILKESCHLLSLISVCPPELCVLVERSHTCKHTLLCTYTHACTTSYASPPLSRSQVKSYSVQLVEHEKKMSEMADLALGWVHPPTIALPCPETTPPIGDHKSSLLGLRTEDRKGLKRLIELILEPESQRNKSYWIKAE